MRHLRFFSYLEGAILSNNYVQLIENSCHIFQFWGVTAGLHYYLVYTCLDSLSKLMGRGLYGK